MSNTKRKRRAGKTQKAYRVNGFGGRDKHDPVVRTRQLLKEDTARQTEEYIGNHGS